MENVRVEILSKEVKMFGRKLSTQIRTFIPYESNTKPESIGFHIYLGNNRLMPIMSSPSALKHPRSKLCSL